MHRNRNQSGSDDSNTTRKKSRSFKLLKVPSFQMASTRRRSEADKERLSKALSSANNQLERRNGPCAFSDVNGPCECRCFSDFQSRCAALGNPEVIKKLLGPVARESMVAFNKSCAKCTCSHGRIWHDIGEPQLMSVSEGRAGFGFNNDFRSEARHVITVDDSAVQVVNLSNNYKGDVEHGELASHTSLELEQALLLEKTDSSRNSSVTDSGSGKRLDIKIDPSGDASAAALASDNNNSKRASIRSLLPKRVGGNVSSGSTGSKRSLLGLGRSNTSSATPRGSRSQVTGGRCLHGDCGCVALTSHIPTDVRKKLMNKYFGEGMLAEYINASASICKGCTHHKLWHAPLPKKDLGTGKNSKQVENDSNDKTSTPRISRRQTTGEPSGSSSRSVNGEGSRRIRSLDYPNYIDSDELSNNESTGLNSLSITTSDNNSRTGRASSLNIEQSVMNSPHSYKTKDEEHVSVNTNKNKPSIDNNTDTQSEHATSTTNISDIGAMRNGYVGGSKNLGDIGSKISDAIGSNISGPIGSESDGNSTIGNGSETGSNGSAYNGPRIDGQTMQPKVGYTQSLPSSPRCLTVDGLSTGSIEVGGDSRMRRSSEGAVTAKSVIGKPIERRDLREEVQVLKRERDTITQALLECDKVMSTKPETSEEERQAAREVARLKNVLGVQ